jgi:hypothetical protein
MMQTLRTGVFAVAEGLRLYFGVALRAPIDSAELREQAAPLRAGLVRDVQSGRA